MNLYFDRQGNPITIDQFAVEFERSDRVVAQSRHRERGREFWLSTVFLGLDHSFGFGPPLIFETMVFEYEPPEWNSVVGEMRGGEECMRWQNEDAARNGHDPWRMTGGERVSAAALRRWLWKRFLLGSAVVMAANSLFLFVLSLVFRDWLYLSVALSTVWFVWSPLVKWWRGDNSFFE